MSIGSGTTFLKCWGISLANFIDKKIGIVNNPIVKNSKEVLSCLEKLLESHNVKYEAYSIDSLKSEKDFVFVIGGDGTLLKTARFYAKHNTPVFGINLGRLGFLAQTNIEELESSINKIINNKYRIEDRLMLSGNSDRYALNDFVIKGPSASRTSRFYLSINSKFVCDYLADGLIITTPTGSTAYGLSAGGPVLSPSLDAFAIIPICPHTLTSRPLVIPANEEITVSTTDSCTNFIVAVDGQEFENIPTKFIIKKAPYNAKLALLDDNEFYSVLRNKLNWGVAPKAHD